MVFLPQNIDSFGNGEVVCSRFGDHSQDDELGMRAEFMIWWRGASNVICCLPTMTRPMFIASLRFSTLFRPVAAAQISLIQAKSTALLMFWW